MSQPQTGNTAPPPRLRIDIDPPDEAQSRLADSVRRLAEAAVMTVAEPGDLLATAAAVDRATDRILGERRQGSYRDLRSSEGGLPFHFNPVLGPANPYAPPIEIRIVDGEVRGSGVINDLYEGPPGYVHGGILSLILDQTLGLANLLAGHPGMTIGLDVRYRRPTPLHQPLEILSRFTHTEGRSIFCSGTIRAGDEVTVEATGTFRAISPERGRQLFAAQLGASEAHHPATDATAS